MFDGFLENHRYTLIALLSGAILIGSGISLGVGLFGSRETEVADVQPFGLEEFKPAGSSDVLSEREITGKININEASADELVLLPGIGPSKAQAIIDYRNKNGPFKSIEAIQNVSGIGPKTFEKLKDLITVK